MEETKEISTQIIGAAPAKMLQQARVVASNLLSIVEDKNLYVMMQGTRHIKVEGWSAMGSMLGILPKEAHVEETDEGDFIATVELVNQQGIVVGGASSMCGVDERNWKNKPRYARRSMAITRATGKAYKLGFSWIISLGNNGEYSTSPAEEMDGVTVKPKATKAQAPNGGGYTGTKAQQEWIKAKLETMKCDEKYWDGIHEAMIGKSASDLDKVVVEVINAAQA